MWKLKLIKLVLHNFKGQKDFTFDPMGNDTSIFGDNATGKTTLYDAFLWLLFGKDSQNKNMDEQIKYKNSLDHGVDHEVEGILQNNGRAVTLKKVFHEKWSKSRGSASKEFNGHETDYFIDGVPSKKKEYDALVGEIADESIFKLLTNPLYFNEQIHWQERRKTLLEVSGDISDGDVIASNPTLVTLPAILQGRTIENHRKVIAAKRAEINKELEKIPVRIDEARRGIPDTTEIFSKEVIETEIASLKKQQQDKQKEIVRIENGGEIAQREKKLREIEGRIINIQNKNNASANNDSFEKRKRLKNLELQRHSLTGSIANDKRELQEKASRAEELSKNIENRRGDYSKRFAEEFIFNHDDVCPTCNQVIPQEQIDEAKSKARTNFNTKRSEALKAINAGGLLLKQTFEKIMSEHSKLHEIVLANESKLKELATQIISLQTDIDNIPAVPDITNNSEYQKEMQEKEAIQQQITDLSSETHTIVRKLQEEINLLNQDISVRDSNIAKINQKTVAEQRIVALEGQEKALSAEFEELERQLYLTEQFIRSKVNLLEDRINSKFKIARFKLFKQQINGGLEECCETLGDGVPWGSGLNNAARINTGLDIINTLSSHYEFSAPIFVDNAEAVTELIKTKSQVIRLVVSEQDKVLRIESDENKSKEVG